MKLKVYVWEDFEDDCWATGLVVAIDENVEQARKQFTDVGWDGDLFAKTPKELDLDNCKPQGFAVRGSD